MKKIFLFVLLIIPIRVLAVSEVSTVDTKKLGVTINLFDYDANDDETADESVYLNEKINTLSPLKFTPCKGTPELGRDITDEERNAAIQGIVKNKLNSNGFPVMYNNENLDVIFNTQTNAYKRVYSNVNHLFKKNSEGNFVFDSDIDYAYYNPSQGNNGNFVLYNPTFTSYRSYASEDKTNAVGFFPFDAYDPTKDNVYPSESTALVGRNGYNHYFGLTVAANLTFPQNGKINGKDILLNFSGDDDVWFFIDDVLVLDLGGIHGTVSGTINLTTGAITTSKAISLPNTSGTIGTSNNISSLFTAAGKTYDTSYNSKHTIKFFYLERGSNASNMSIETNLWNISGDTGQYRVRFYKDGVLQDTQYCDYSNDTKKCPVNSLTNPTGDTYHLTDCNGTAVSDVPAYIVSQNTDLYACTPGKWRVRYYKDGVLQDTQYCTYDARTKACAINSLTNPTGDLYHLTDCKGTQVNSIPEYIVKQDTDMYVCTITNPKTGRSSLMIIITEIMCLVSIFFVYRGIKKQ